LWPLDIDHGCARCTLVHPIALAVLRMEDRRAFIVEIDDGEFSGDRDHEPGWTTRSRKRNRIRLRVSRPPHAAR
jgi:hypothetical protein